MAGAMINAFAAYRIVFPDAINEHLIEEGYVFELPLNKCPDFASSDNIHNRTYKAIKRYKYFMLCESVTKFGKHMRAIDWFTLQSAENIRK